MATDSFLKMDNVEGESKDKVHKKEIDVLAWSWGMAQSGSFGTGGGGGSGKASFQSLSVTKYIDKSTPTIQLYCASGQHFKKARLTVRKAGGKDPLEYLVIDMKKVLVTSYQTGGSGGEDRLTENISLNFAEVSVQYKEQKEDGSGDTPITFDWSIEANAQL